MNISISVEGLEQTIGALQGIAQRARDISPVAPDVALVLQADVDERFNSAPSVESGGPVYGGATWPALSPAYLKARPERQGGQILRDTGELLNSYQVGNPENIWEVSPNLIVFGTNLPQAGYLAARFPQLIVHAALIQQLERLFTIWIVEGKA